MAISTNPDRELGGARIETLEADSHVGEILEAGFELASRAGDEVISDEEE